MREMKDSGIPWLGQIDKRVVMKPIKYLLEQGKNSVKVGPFGSQLSGADLQNYETNYWVYNQRSVIDKNSYTGTSFISEEKYKLMVGFQVKSGDILITTRGTIGKLFRIPEKYNKGIIHPCIIRFRTNDNLIEYDLLELLFNESDLVSRQLFYESNSTTIEVIYSETLKNIKVPVWEMSYQKQLVRFLKEKCSEIYSLSADIQSEIDTLQAYKWSVITEAVTKGLDKNVPMKDSGIPWIGSVPEHWAIYRIADLYCDRNERGNDELPLLTVSINSGVSDKELSDEEQDRVFIRSEDKTKYKRVYAGDITYNMMRAWQGAFGAVRVNGMVSPAYVVAKQTGRAEIDSRYIEALLRSPMGIEEMNRYSYGIMDFRKRLYWPQFRIIKVCLPDIQEQKRIADYIDAKSKEIDEIIGQKQEQLQMLAEYRKSVIYEYVTGKKEVPAI